MHSLSSTVFQDLEHEFENNTSQYILKAVHFY